MSTVLEWGKAMAEKVSGAQAILAAEAPSPEQLLAAQGMLEEAEALKGRIELAERAEKTAQYLNRPAATVEHPDPDPEQHGLRKGSIFASPRRLRGNSFRDDDVMRADEKAYAFGRLALSVRGDMDSQKWLRDKGIATKALAEGVGTSGGYAVPEMFNPDLIEIITQYGVIRQVAQIENMNRDRLNRPIRTGGTTAYFVGEGTAITESSPTFGNVALTAKKLAALTLSSAELSEDAVIDIGNRVAREISIAFAEKEDRCGILGDGTSTYGGMSGLTVAFQKTVTDAGGTWTTDAHKIYNPSIVCATGNAFSEVTLTDTLNVIGARLAAPVMGRLAWLCNSAFYWTVLARLIESAGGTTATELVDGVTRQTYQGYPVYFAECMISQEANSGCPLLFGDFASAMMFGDRRELTLAMSTDYKFAEDQLAWKGTERFDINVHSLGTANSAAASRVRGPIAMLALANA